MTNVQALITAVLKIEPIRQLIGRTVYTFCPMCDILTLGTVATMGDLDHKTHCPFYIARKEVQKRYSELNEQ